MIRKINLISFIFLFIFLIGTVSATTIENETQTINNDLEISDDKNIQAIDNIETSNEILSTPKAKTLTIINSPPVEMYYKDGSKLIATLTDNNNYMHHPISNAKVIININGVNYTKITDSRGQVMLSLNLESGEYMAKIIFEGCDFYHPSSSNSKVTIKPTINGNDIVKYHKNDTQYYVEFSDKKGNPIINCEITLNINGVFYKKITNMAGIITAMYNSCFVSNKILVKPTIQTNDLEMNFKDGSTFKTFVTTNEGKPVGAGENVTFNINGVFYTKTTNSNSIAALNINLNPGEYIITTHYKNIQIGNKIIIHPANSTAISENLNRDFTYEIAIPNYVNVTLPKVEAKNNYTVKLGEKGIVKLPKKQIFEINNGLKNYILSNYETNDKTSVLINDKYVFIPLGENKIKTGKTARIQKGNGILIYSSENYTYIQYYNSAERDISQFGVTIDKEGKMGERINYIENGEIRASVLFNTIGFDEYGIRYNLALANGLDPETELNSNYIILTNNKISPIKFTSTNKTITLNTAREKIIGYITNEKINTIFKTNNNLVEKTETITYGTHPKYNANNNFEIVQSYAIINSKITPTDIENLAFGLDYLTSYKLKYVQGMFLSGLNTAYLSDLNADKYAEKLSLNWQRTKTAVVLGGIDNDKLYIHIANPNMGMYVIGKNATKITEFNFITSLLLSKIEQQVMNPIGIIYSNEMTSSFDEVMDALLKSEVNLVNHGDSIYVFCKNGNKSVLILNTTTGICKTVLVDDDFAYKGATQKTDKGECTVCIIPKLFEESLTNQLKNIREFVDNGIIQINKNIDNFMKNIHPSTIIGYNIGVLSLKILGGAVSGISTIVFFPATFAIAFQSVANKYRVTFVDEDDTHYWYSHFTPSRPGYFQDTKLFLIPKGNQEVDYVEVHINSDNSLNRSQAKYISSGNVRNLTKEETYQYFDEEYWDPLNTPRKLGKY